MVRIGVDLTPLQGPHRLRGVGSVIINFVRNIPFPLREQCKFTFYLYPELVNEALDLAGVDDSFNFEIRNPKKTSSALPSIKTLRGILHIPVRLYRQILQRSWGNDELPSVEELDVLLQFEQDKVPPNPRKVKTVVVAYDLIPYVLEKDYLMGYRTARRLHHYSRKASLLAYLRRKQYLYNIRLVSKLARQVVAISHHTANDFLRYAKVPQNKLSIAHLGVTKMETATKATEDGLRVERYVGTSWGDIMIPATLPTKPFVLFIGGVDPRRKIVDLVEGFNILRAQGQDLQLVLAGDTMLGPNSIPNLEAGAAIRSSSYKEDILFFGFVSDNVREYLYENATAFVYPTRYEGFGLPILEAMRYGTPVITYNNSSVSEIAGSAALYASDGASIAKNITTLLENKKNLSLYRSLSLEQANKFSWEKTSKSMAETLLEIANAK